MLAGVVAAHALAFRLTVPAWERATVLAQTGHRWFAYLPLVLGAAGALLVLGVARRVTASDRSHPAAWPFAIFPPLALFLQEQLERGHPALDTTIAAGVLLAVPLGLAAYALLRALLHVSDTLVAALRARPPVHLLPPRAAVTVDVFAPLSPALAPLGARGPPSNAR
jgi:hypothetical protein